MLLNIAAKNKLFTLGKQRTEVYTTKNWSIYNKELKYIQQRTEVYTTKNWSIHNKELKYTQQRTEVYTTKNWSIYNKELKYIAVCLQHSSKSAFYYQALFSIKCTIRLDILYRNI